MQTDLLCVILRPGRRVRYKGEWVTIESRSSNDVDLFACRADGGLILAPWYKFDGYLYRTKGYAYKYDSSFRSRPRVRSSFPLSRTAARVLFIVEGPVMA